MRRVSGVRRTILLPIFEQLQTRSRCLKARIKSKWAQLWHPKHAPCCTDRSGASESVERAIRRIEGKIQIAERYGQENAVFLALSKRRGSSTPGP
jgi:hypothetical protein